MMMKGHNSYKPEQFEQVGPFCIKSVSGNAQRHTATRKRTTHGNYPYVGIMPAHNTEKVRSGHTRHLQVRDDEVWKLLLDLAQCSSSVLRRTHIMATASEDVGEGPH